MGFTKTNRFDSILDIAHQPSDLKKASLWLYKDGKLYVDDAPEGISHLLHGDLGPNTSQSGRYLAGRIDHVKRLISLYYDSKSPRRDEAKAKYAAKIIQKRFPSYKIYAFDNTGANGVYLYEEVLKERKGINQNRMVIGHHTSPEFIQLYWADRRGNLELRFSIDPNDTSRLGKDHRMFEKNAKGLAKMPFKGRIDHKYREISILPKDAKLAKKSNYEKLVGNVVKKLRKKFRNYSIFYYDDFVQDMILTESKKETTHKYEFENKVKMNGFVKTLKDLSLGQKVTSEDMTVIVSVKNPMNLEIIDSLASDYKASLEETNNIDFISHNLLLNEESINIDDNVISQHVAASIVVFHSELNEENKIKFERYLTEDFDRMLEMVLNYGDSDE